ncbi:MAG: hypothetical protein H6683_06380 [Deltaproteobacteria bacterium]|nr:hypothetical protein [Deltaproteobacteria bacterium]
MPTKSPLRRRVVFALIPLIVLAVVATVVLSRLEREGVIDTGRPADQVAMPPVDLVRREKTDEGEVFVVDAPMMLRTAVPVKKAPNEFRIVLTGGSFAQGDPYLNHDFSEGFFGSIATWMQAELSMRYPEARIRVINAAAAAQTSGRVAAIVEQTRVLDPDLYVVLTGNNEGNPPASTLQAALHEWVAYRALKKGLRPDLSPEQRGYFQPDQEAVRQIVANYQRNIGSIVATAREAGVPLVLGTLPINLKYVPTDAEALRHAVTTLPMVGKGVVRAMDDCRAGRTDGGIAALADERDSPWALRALAECYELAGDFDAARSFYKIFVEQVPLIRMRPSLNDWLREALPTWPGVALADLEKEAEDASPSGIPDPGLFLDVCHMLWRGYYLMARPILRAIVDARWIPGTPRPAPTMDEVLDAAYPSRRFDAMHAPYAVDPNWPRVLRQAMLDAKEGRLPAERVPLARPPMPSGMTPPPPGAGPPTAPTPATPPPYPDVP